MRQYAPIDLRDCVQSGERSLAELPAESDRGGESGTPWSGDPSGRSPGFRQPSVPPAGSSFGYFDGDLTRCRRDRPSSLYPSGVEVCSTPTQYYHVLRRSRGEICACLPGPPSSVLRYEVGEWYCYERRAGRPPRVERLDRAAALERLRGDRPVLVADREVADLLAAGAGRRRDSPSPDRRESPGGRRAASCGGPAGGTR